MGRVPGVQGLRGVQTGKLGGDRLAHHYRARLFQAGQHGGVLVRNEVGVDAGAGRGGDSGGVEDVLYADGHTMQRARVGQGVQLPLALLCVGQHGLAVDVDPGLQGFQRISTSQESLGDIDGADLAGANLAGQLDGGEFVDIGHLCSSLFSSRFRRRRSGGRRTLPTLAGGGCASRWTARRHRRHGIGSPHRRVAPPVAGRLAGRPR